MIDDLCKIPDITDSTLIETLQQRYASGRMYTHSGLVLLSLNPYADLHIYGENVMRAFIDTAGNSDPHIYSTAESLYRDMMLGKSQTVIISGESGAGKTENTRHVIDYLLYRTNTQMDFKDKISSANIILEAFGNARTVINNNSSRFGKKILMYVNNSIQGAKINTYLLEKSRVTHQSPGERNFHIFYMFCAYKNLCVKNDYLEFDARNNFSDIVDEGTEKNIKFKDDVDGENGILCDEKELSEENLRKCYESVLDAMREIDNIDIGLVENILMTIIHLGSIKFNSAGVLKVEKDTAFFEACRLLSVDEDIFETYLTKHHINIKTEVIEVFNTEQSAYILRNSIARLLYASIFNYINDRINESLAGQQTDTTISILDIFGFEVFDKNGLDQLCINWTNEKIQNEFIRRVFQDKQELYKSEGLEWTDIDFKTNDECLHNFEKRCGLIDLINEESFSAWGNIENLGTKIHNYVGSYVKLKSRDRIVVKHYACDVEYDLNDFLYKNREKGELSIFDLGIDKIRGDKSVVSSFKISMDKLFDEVNSTQIKYVRCIKPNKYKLSKEFDSSLVYNQLNATGVMETVRISMQCYNQEIDKDRFFERYKWIDEEFLNKSGYKEGINRIFMTNRTLQLLECSRNLIYTNNLQVFATTITRFIKKVKEQRKKEEEARRVYEEMMRKDEEERRMYEEARAKDEEDRKKEEEARRVYEELVKKDEEERRKYEDARAKDEEDRRKNKEERERTKDISEKLVESSLCNESAPNSDPVQDEPSKKFDKSLIDVDNKIKNKLENIKIKGKQSLNMFYKIQNIRKSREILNIEKNKMKIMSKRYTEDKKNSSNTNNCSKMCEKELRVDNEDTSKKIKDLTSIKEYEEEKKDIYKDIPTGITDPYEIIKILEEKLIKYRRFYNKPCRNCEVLELKYKCQTEALQSKNFLELEVERYKRRIEELEEMIRNDEVEDDDVELASSNNIFGCLIELFLEYTPAFGNDDLPKFEILSLGHLAYNITKNVNNDFKESVSVFVEEISIRLSVFERNMHKVLYVLTNLIEYRNILNSEKIEYSNDLPYMIEVLFKHVCDLQRGFLLEVLPHSITEHQPLKNFRCTEGYLKKIFKPPTIDKLIKLLEYFYYQMEFYHLPEAFIKESLNYMLKTANTSVFNTLLVKKNFLSFNRNVQINYNLNEIEKFCLSIGYSEGMLNLGHSLAVVRLVNLAVTHAPCDTVLEQCSILSCLQIREIVDRVDGAVEYVLGNDNNTEKFLPDPRVEIPTYSVTCEYNFVVPRYVPSKSIAGLVKICKNKI